VVQGLKQLAIAITSQPAWRLLAFSCDRKVRVVKKIIQCAKAHCQPVVAAGDLTARGATRNGGSVCRVRCLIHEAGNRELFPRFGRFPGAQAWVHGHAIASAHLVPRGALLRLQRTMQAWAKQSVTSARNARSEGHASRGACARRLNLRATHAKAMPTAVPTTNYCTHRALRPVAPHLEDLLKRLPKVDT
jgi:hypothetical protein